MGGNTKWFPGFILYSNNYISSTYVFKCKDISCKSTKFNIVFNV